MRVRAATMDDDPRLCELARLSRYTRDFASILYVRKRIEKLYDEKSIGVAMPHHQGFICVPHLKRHPWSTIYYMGVGFGSQRTGVGRALVEWAMKVSPHGRLRLVCEESNEGAIKFYQALGFQTYERGASKGGHPFLRMEVTRGDI